MKSNLTPRQTEVFNAVQQFISERGESPTLPELMEILGVSTKKGVAFHLDTLEKKGWISRTGLGRGIRLIRDLTGNFVPVAIIGYANAGDPLIDVKEEFIGEIMVEEKILHPRRVVFGIELRGDSMDLRIMNGVNMKSGNYVIVAKDAEYSDGDVVLAEINGSATVKTYYKRGDKIVLAPESTNPIHHPIYMNLEQTSLLGKVITVLDNPISRE